MLLRPARVLVLLAVLGRLGFPVFRHLACLDRLVVLARTEGPGEDHDFIPRLASRRTLAFRLAPAKLAFNQIRNQLWPEGFERNHRRNRYKRIVLFGETFIASVQIEEAK